MKTQVSAFIDFFQQLGNPSLVSRNVWDKRKDGGDDLLRETRKSKVGRETVLVFSKIL